MEEMRKPHAPMRAAHSLDSSTASRSTSSPCTASDSEPTDPAAEALVRRADNAAVFTQLSDKNCALSFADKSDGAIHAQLPEKVDGVPAQLPENVDGVPAQFSGKSDGVINAQPSNCGKVESALPPASIETAQAECNVNDPQTVTSGGDPHSARTTHGRNTKVTKRSRPAAKAKVVRRKKKAVDEEVTSELAEIKLQRLWTSLPVFAHTVTPGETQERAAPVSSLLRRRSSTSRRLKVDNVNVDELERERLNRLELERREMVEIMEREKQGREKREKAEKARRGKLVKAEREKIEREKAEALRLESERLQKLAKERADALEKIEQEKVLREVAKQEAERLERERLERLEEDRLVRLERERLAKFEEQRLERERLERAEEDRLVRNERERLAKETARLERERRAKVEKEKVERDRTAKLEERLERERLAKLEEDRAERESLVCQEAKQIEKERLLKLEEERLGRARLAQLEEERLAKLEEERLLRERLAILEEERLERENTAQVQEEQLMGGKLAPQGRTVRESRKKLNGRNREKQEAQKQEREHDKEEDRLDRPQQGGTDDAPLSSREREVHRNREKPRNGRGKRGTPRWLRETHDALELHSREPSTKLGRTSAPDAKGICGKVREDSRGDSTTPTSGRGSESSRKRERNTIVSVEGRTGANWDPASAPLLKKRKTVKGAVAELQPAAPKPLTILGSLRRSLRVKGSGGAAPTNVRKGIRWRGAEAQLGLPGFGAPGWESGSSPSTARLAAKSAAADSSPEQSDTEGFPASASCSSRARQPSDEATGAFPPGDGAESPESSESETAVDSEVEKNRALATAIALTTSAHMPLRGQRQRPPEVDRHVDAAERRRIATSVEMIEMPRPGRKAGRPVSGKRECVLLTARGRRRRMECGGSSPSHINEHAVLDCAPASSSITKDVIDADCSLASHQKKRVRCASVLSERIARFEGPVTRSRAKRRAELLALAPDPVRTTTTAADSPIRGRTTDAKETLDAEMGRAKTFNAPTTTRRGKLVKEARAKPRDAVAQAVEVTDQTCLMMSQGAHLAQCSRLMGTCVISLEPVFDRRQMSGYRLVFCYGALQFFVRVGLLSKELRLTALQYRGGARHDVPGRGQKVRDLLLQAEKRYHLASVILHLQDVPPISFLRSGVFLHIVVRSCEQGFFS